MRIVHKPLKMIILLWNLWIILMILLSRYFLEKLCIHQNKMWTNFHLTNKYQKILKRVKHKIIFMIQEQQYFTLTKGHKNKYLSHVKISQLRNVTALKFKTMPHPVETPCLLILTTEILKKFSKTYYKTSIFKKMIKNYWI